MLEKVGINTEWLIETQEDSILLFTMYGKLLYANLAAKKLFFDNGTLPYAGLDAVILIDQETGESILGPGLIWNIKEEFDRLHERFLMLCLPGEKMSVVNCRAYKGISESGEIIFLLSIRDISTIYQNFVDLRYLNFHDRLTDLYNRAFFEEEMERLNKSRQLPISIIVGDVNGLKIVNDVFGHLAGDHLLKRIAEVFKQVCREEDIISRWGGDEFVVLLPGASAESADSICERLKEACSDEKEGIYKISIALGHATKTDLREEMIDVFITAENAMYKNKLVEGSHYKHSLMSTLKEVFYKDKSPRMLSYNRIQRYIKKIIPNLGLSENERIDFELALIFRDIGKIAIPSYILEKKESLTVQEWDEIRRHPEIGYRLALATAEMSSVSSLILAHHEHWDGSGYPLGISGEDIPKLSRLIGIFDAYFAITEERPYRKRSSHEEAIDELRRCAGKQFDPVLVEAVIPILEELNQIKSP